jgi:membrane-bound lytic murein transglycosylase B
MAMMFRLPAFLLTLLLSSSLLAQDSNPQSFDEWLLQLRQQAGSLGISSATLDAAFADVAEPQDRVLELDRSQPEFVQTFTGYMRNRMSDARIARGRQLLEEHKDLFARIQAQYGVQPHYLVAFWALESNFGDYTGGFSVIRALATLAYDPRRSDFFRSELLTALRIIEDGHIAADRMTGSWAGAMGQCQFMPSTFSAYGTDGDGDGKVDIWNSLPDVFASAANFLSRSGWRGDERWGREIILPEGFDFELAGTSVRKTVTEWNRMGLRRADGSPLGNADLQASVVIPAGANGPAFLTYNNFRTIMVWNRSTFYAISVGHLADRFVGSGPIRYMPTTEEQALARADVLEMQELLNAAGVDAGIPDGILGSKTREAVRNYQMLRGLPPDGYPTYELLVSMREDTTTN